MQNNALPSETTTINGRQYQVTQLPYTIGFKLFVRLFKALAPSLAEAISQAPKVSGDAQISLSNLVELAPAISASLKTLATELTEADFDYTVKTLAEYTLVSTESGGLAPLSKQMEFLFAGNYGELLEWLYFSLKFNYLSFFTRLASAAVLPVGSAAPQQQRKVRRS